eukprot:jgi/Bigna1/86429/estExt_fgenesh1_pg.C_100227
MESIAGVLAEFELQIENKVWKVTKRVINACSETIGYFEDPGPQRVDFVQAPSRTHRLYKSSSKNKFSMEDEESEEEFSDEEDRSLMDEHEQDANSATTFVSRQFDEKSQMAEDLDIEAVKREVERLGNILNHLLAKKQQPSPTPSISSSQAIVAHSRDASSATPSELLHSRNHGYGHEDDREREEEDVPFDEKSQVAEDLDIEAVKQEVEGLGYT